MKENHRPLLNIVEKYMNRGGDFLMKRIIFLLVTMLLITGTCFADTKQKTDDDYYIMVDRTKVYAKNLIISDAEGDYAGYKRMMGFPGDDKFAIYFCDDPPAGSNMARLSVVDNRGIDLNEVFYYTYTNGLPGAITRGDAETVFDKLSDTDYELFLRATFPGAYNDWFEKEAFYSTASELLKCYDRFRLDDRKSSLTSAADIVIDDTPSTSPDLDGTVTHQGWF